MKKFFREFKAFISRGNILDLAIGVIIGNAFSAIVSAFTDKIIMPLINLALSSGGNGLDSAYTFLKYVEDPLTCGADLEKSIFIDWGAFITAILNFLIIALTLFVILKVAMKSSEILNKANKTLSKGKLSKEEKRELKARGISVRDKDAVEAFRKEKAEIAAKLEAEELAKAEAEKLANPSEADLLKEIRDLLKAKTTEKKLNK